MEFRPCIDIHNGYVKQIVGSSLKDENNEAVNNFVSDKDGAYYANLFKEYNLKGGHVILLNSANSDYRKASEEQAKCALLAFPDGLQIGGGINEENAWSYLDMGASHVIVTSYVFRCGRVNMENLEKISKCVGKNRLVIDLSCRKLDGEYKIVTDRWQNFTDISLNKETLDMFSDYCDEFLVHAVDVEGKSKGIEEDVVKILADGCCIPVTYAGGIHDYKDIEAIRDAGKQKVNFTIGSALDIYGGDLLFDRVASYDAR